MSADDSPRPHEDLGEVEPDYYDEASCSQVLAELCSQQVVRLQDLEQELERVQDSNRLEKQLQEARQQCEWERLEFEEKHRQMVSAQAQLRRENEELFAKLERAARHIEELKFQVQEQQRSRSGIMPEVSPFGATPSSTVMPAQGFARSRSVSPAPHHQSPRRSVSPAPCHQPARRSVSPAPHRGPVAMNASPGVEPYPGVMASRTLHAPQRQCWPPAIRPSSPVLIRSSEPFGQSPCLQTPRGLSAPAGLSLQGLSHSQPLLANSAMMSSMCPAADLQVPTIGHSLSHLAFPSMPSTPGECATPPALGSSFASIGTPGLDIQKGNPAWKSYMEGQPAVLTHAPARNGLLECTGGEGARPSDLPVWHDGLTDSSKTLLPRSASGENWRYENGFGLFREDYAGNCLPALPEGCTSRDSQQTLPPPSGTTHIASRDASSLSHQVSQTPGLTAGASHRASTRGCPPGQLLHGPSPGHRASTEETVSLGIDCKARVGSCIIRDAQHRSPAAAPGVNSCESPHDEDPLAAVQWLSAMLPEVASWPPRHHFGSSEASTRASPGAPTTPVSGHPRSVPPSGCPSPAPSHSPGFPRASAIDAQGHRAEAAPYNNGLQQRRKANPGVVEVISYSTPSDNKTACAVGSPLPLDSMRS